MRDRLRIALSACLAVVLLLTSLPGASKADAGWEISEQTVSARFSESLDVALGVQHEQTITEVVLFYGRVGDRIVRRIYPPFRPGEQVQVVYSEPLERGQFAPGTDLRIWWQLEDSSGSVYKTPESRLLYTDENHDWQSISGDGATLYYYDVRRSRASSWLDTAEGALDRIASEIGLSPLEEISIYVYRNEADMRPAVATRSDDYDARVTTLGVAVDERTLIVLAAQDALEQTMAHELSHIVVGMATDNPYAGLPRWLDEGLAMLAEGELPAQNAIALRLAIAADELLSVRSMTSYSGRPDQVDLYYGECYSVVNYLIEEYGRDKMRELLDVFSEGILQDDALRRVYGLDVDELDARWRESLGLKRRGELPPVPMVAAMVPI